MNEPKPVSGISAAATWLTQLKEWAKQFRLLPGPGYRIRRYPEGYTLELLAIGAGGVGAPVGISFYTFQSHGTTGPPDQTDYVLCQPLGGGATVLVLKPPLLRFSLKTHGSITYLGWDANLQQRAALGAGVQVQQTITPMYIKGDILYVQKIGNDLYDLNVDNRTFAGP